MTILYTTPLQQEIFGFFSSKLVFLNFFKTLQKSNIQKLLNFKFCDYERCTAKLVLMNIIIKINLLSPFVLLHVRVEMLFNSKYNLEI